MARRLSKKQKGFVKDIIKGKTGVQAALDNYDTKDYNTANVIAVENLQKPTIQKAIKSIADCIPDKLLVEKHLELLNVPRRITIRQKGLATIEEEEVDSNAISKGLDMAYKIKGTYAPEKKLTLNVDANDLLENDQLQRIARRIENGGNAS